MRRTAATPVSAQPATFEPAGLEPAGFEPAAFDPPAFDPPAAAPHADAPDAPEPPAAPAGPDAIDFAAVPVRPRSDGWTPEKQQSFIAGLADTGSVTKAALGVGMSPDSAYRLRRRADAGHFDQAWEAAIAVATRRLVDVAFERAIDGIDNPVFHKGEVVGFRRTVSDRLLMFLLRHHDPLIYGSMAGPLGYDPTPADPRGPRIRRFPDLLARLDASAESRSKGRSEGRTSSTRLSRP